MTTHFFFPAVSGEVMTMSVLEDVARNCSLRLEHIQALNISNMSVLMRLYNMCEHTWDPDKTWDVYYWEELLPPLVIYRYDVTWCNHLQWTVK